MQIPYGISDFRTIRKEDYLFIDKTQYIEKLEKQRIVMYVRPRRFGKSLFTSILDYYYAIDKKEEFEQLFKGLYIYDHQTPNKNSYYIMNFNFSGMEADARVKVEEIENQFKDIVIQALEDFIERYKLQIKINTQTTAANALRSVLSGFKNLNLGNNIYVIIDEYDHFTNGMLEGKCDKFLNILGTAGFVRAFYEVIKIYTGTSTVDRFFATGVAPLTLDSMTNGFNIATHLSLEAQYVDMCGLTHEEVKWAISQIEKDYEKQQKIYKEMKENYDGYRFSEESEIRTFNTTLVMYYLDNYLKNGKPPRELIDGNLAASGSKIQNIVELIDREKNYEILKDFILGKEIDGKIVRLFELEKHFDTNDFISMLFYNGYLTIKDVQGMITTYKIPNYISEKLYAEYMITLVDIQDKYKVDISELQRATIQFGQKGNIEYLVKYVQEFLMYCSVRDKENFTEKELKHVFQMMLALTTQYYVYGEYPAGQGFADIYLQKSTNSLATYEAVIELKYLNKEKARKSNIKRLTKEAKKQVERYLEDKRLNQKENLKKYVIIFEGFEKYYLEEIC